MKLQVSTLLFEISKEMLEISKIKLYINLVNNKMLEILNDILNISPNFSRVRLICLRFRTEIFRCQPNYES